MKLHFTVTSKIVQLKLINYTLEESNNRGPYFKYIMGSCCFILLIILE